MCDANREFELKNGVKLNCVYIKSDVKIKRLELERSSQEGLTKPNILRNLVSPGFEPPKTRKTWRDIWPTRTLLMEAKYLTLQVQSAMCVGQWDSPSKYARPSIRLVHIFWVDPDSQAVAWRHSTPRIGFEVLGYSGRIPNMHVDSAWPSSTSLAACGEWQRYGTYLVKAIETDLPKTLFLDRYGVCPEAKWC